MIWYDMILIDSDIDFDHYNLYLLNTRLWSLCYRLGLFFVCRHT